MTALRSTMRRGSAIVAWVSSLAAAGVIVTPIVALAHAVVFPKTSAPGAYERYVLRVPNEKTVATTRVEIRFPQGLRVTSFADVPGWKLDVKTDSAGAIVAAVWTGTLAPKHFIELPFMGANPKTPTTLTWPTFQTYADGEVREWTGAEGSKSPASATVLAAPVEPTPPPPAASGLTMGVAWAALVVALLGLGVALRRGRADA